jgi:hypothetical protein
MLRIGVVTIILAGIYASIKGFTKAPAPEISTYRISSFNAEHGCFGEVQVSDDYHLLLLFDQDLKKLKKPALRFRRKHPYVKCSNQIKDIKIFSTEKINETHPAGEEISDLFIFHYVRNMENKYGTLIKEGMAVPLSEFENLVDQDNSAKQFRRLSLRLAQKPIIESELQFIVQVFFENGEVKSDTTECISFEGIHPE